LETAVKPKMLTFVLLTESA